MRMCAAGFKVGEPYIIEAATPGTHATDNFYNPVRLCIDFQCACGRREVFNTSLEEKALREFLANPHLWPEWRGGWDACLEIERFGSTSVEHLKEDGFSDADIKRIRYVYDLEDELKKLRRMKSVYQSQIGEYEL